MNILILGGSGFIGNVLIKALLEEKHNVHSFDNKKIEFNHYKFKQTNGDLQDINKYKKIFKKIDIVYHLAGVSSLDYALKNPEETIKLNILSTIRILKICKVEKIKKFFYASSLYVNGHHGSYYRCSKIAAENYIKEFSKINKLNYFILRFGSVYGRGSSNDNGIHKIIYNYIKTKKLKYSGDSESMREYIHVYDVARGCIKLLKSKKNNLTINLSGIQRIKIKDLLLMLSEILGFDGKIEFKKDKMLGHYKYSAYNSDPEYPSKIVLDYNVDFEEGLKDTIKYIKNNLEN